MNKVLTKHNFIPSKRQPYNLSRLTKRACFLDKPKGGCTKCGDKKCGTCDYIEETPKIKITSTGRDFVIKSPMNCKSKMFYT